MARRSCQPDASSTQESTQEPSTQELSATMRGEESASSWPQGQEDDGIQDEDIPDELMLLAESELNQRIQLA